MIDDWRIKDGIQGWEINLRVWSRARQCGQRLEVQSEVEVSCG